MQTFLLVGADGNMSAVQQQVIGHGPPCYTGQATWRGLLQRPDLWTWSEGTEDGSVNFVGGPTSVRIIAMSSLADEPPLLVCLAVVPWSEVRLDELSSAAYVPMRRVEQTQARRRRLLDAFKGCTEQLGWVGGLEVGRSQIVQSLVHMLSSVP